MSNRLSAAFFALLFCVALPAHAAKLAEPVTLDSLRQFFAKPENKVLTQLLASLPEQYLRHFTLAWKSRSRQAPGVSENYPRVLVFSPDANLVIAFTTDPSRYEYGEFEAMQFDPKTRSFKFESFKLREPSTAGLPPSARAAMKCANCHGTPARPIWEVYPNWPGFHGQSDDYVLGEQVNWYSAFRGGIRRGDRASFLEWKNTSPVYPYRTREQEKDYTLRPNLRVTKLLERLNAKWLAEKLWTSEASRPYRFYVTGLLNACLFSETIDEFVQKHPLPPGTPLVKFMGGWDEEHLHRDHLLTVMGFKDADFSIDLARASGPTTTEGSDYEDGLFLYAILEKAVEELPSLRRFLRPYVQREYTADDGVNRMGGVAIRDIEGACEALARADGSTRSR